VFVLSKKLLRQLFPHEKPIIGMIHLRALPGSPRYDPETMDMERIIALAVEEARMLQDQGVDGLQVENIHDFPYLPGEAIGPETAASLAVATHRVIQAVSIPVGVNCHLNGGMQALAAAVAAGGGWIRVFEWVNAYVSHAGLTEGIGAKLARYRSFLKAEAVRFFCDVNVKHGSHFLISDRSVEEQAFDAESEGAEAIIVTGFETGQAPTPEKVRRLASAVGIPLLLGSGVSVQNAASLLEFADGAIVGSAFKKEGNWKNPVDPQRVREFMRSVEEIRREGRAK